MRRVPARRHEAPRPLVAAVMLLAIAATAAASPEDRCQGNRYFAGANYARCQLKAAAKYYANAGTDVPKYQDAARKCAEAYATMWRRLQDRASGTGSTCDGTRFVDGGDGTGTDKLTGPQWGEKTDDGGVHGKGDPHPLSPAARAAPA